MTLTLTFNFSSMSDLLKFFNHDAPEKLSEPDQIDRFINWVALSEALTGKPQNIRKDYIPQKYAHDINRLRSTLRNWLVYTKVFKKE